MRSAGPFCAKCGVGHRHNAYSYCLACLPIIRAAARARFLAKHGKIGVRLDRVKPPEPPRKRRGSDLDDREIRHPCDVCGVVLYDGGLRCHYCAALTKGQGSVTVRPRGRRGSVAGHSEAR